MKKDRKPFVFVAKPPQGAPVVLAVLSERRTRAERAARRLADTYRDTSCRFALVRSGADLADVFGDTPRE